MIRWLSGNCVALASSVMQATAARRCHRTLILGSRRIAVAEVVDAWLAPEYRYFKLRGADGTTYLVRHDEHSDTWELTCSARTPLT